MILGNVLVLVFINLNQTIMKKKCKVVMLPTEDKSGTIWKTPSGQLIHTHVSGKYKNKYTPQHLYIVSDDEIEEGDWCLTLNSKSVIKANRPLLDLIEEGDKMVGRNHKKIIATTDISLIVSDPNNLYDPRSKTGYEPHSLPQIPDWFINNYCANNGIDEVEVNYETFIFYDDEQIITFLEVDSQNEVVLNEIEEKLYTREEVINLCRRAYSEGNCWGKGYNNALSKSQWIKENL